MAQNFKETAHLNTNKKKYDKSYDRIFNKIKKEVAVGPQKTTFKKVRDIKKIPELFFPFIMLVFSIIMLCQALEIEHLEDKIQSHPVKTRSK